MIKYDPNIHHRRSIRLKGYDYSRAGLYFITICCQDRICRFGDVVNGEMVLNDAGKMIAKWYFELGNKYPDKQCREMIVMPNHIHCIVENKTLDDAIADGRVGHNGVTNAHVMDAHVGTSLRGRPDTQYGIDNQKYGATIGNAMDWFKTMTTNEYIRGVKTMNWKTFNRRLWQRNYWERIIRNQKAYHRIAEYILNNPEKWRADIFFKS